MKTLRKIIYSILITFSLIAGASWQTLASEEPTDEKISQAIQEELLFNATTPSYLIDIKVNEGIATLSGDVNNILAKDRAVSIARSVKGVRGVIDHLNVETENRPDNQLKKDIENALLEDPATDSYEVNVAAKNGEVTLTGNVESWQEKELAGFVAKGIKGVKSIKNNINIDYIAERSDYEIKKDITEALKNDIRVDNALIDISVQNGNVELSGIVGSDSEKMLARTIAWTTGVQSVNIDNLKIEGWARDERLRKGKYVKKSDDEIENAVYDAFLYDPRVYSFNPVVSVDNGVVSLTGDVDNLKAKKAAENDAKNVVGVLFVKNDLRVRPTYIPDDEDLKSDVVSALKKNPIVEKWEISVSALNGVVTLNGTVDSNFEKSQAENTASKTKGVVAINNNLEVNNTAEKNYYDYYGWNTYYPIPVINRQDYYKTDNEIKADIGNQLWWSPYVNRDEVNISVDNGKVTLNGVVDTRREKLYAEINAYEGGADEVNNNLKVKYMP